MPTLNWIGKEAVVDHHRHIPTRLLECDPKLSFGDPDTENLLVEGDNLEALKALLPRYRGQVKCIYIDPPYNTGNENWIYNDNVNDPRIKKWLGQVVGKEAEDLCRHDKWLCMMYPRLAMLREFLTEDGVFLCSIDENEVYLLKTLLDEIFGSSAYLGTIVWKMRNVDNRVKSFLSTDHEYVLVYSKCGKLQGRVIDRSDFKNPDNDSRGSYTTDPLTGKATAADRPNLHYEIVDARNGFVYQPDPARGWIPQLLEGVFMTTTNHGPFGPNGERPPGWPPPPFDPPGEPLPYVPPPDPPGSSSEPRPDWWPEDWVWPPVPEPPIEVLVPPPLPNIIWPRLPPHHPYHLPPGYHWPDNLPPGHPGHDVKPPKPPGGSGDAGSEGSGDEAGSSDSEGC